MPWLLTTLCDDSTGATAVEYALMVALIALVIIAAVSGIAEAVIAMFEDVRLRGALGT
jgi:Flp pilus assembly pilin Flp